MHIGTKWRELAQQHGDHPAIIDDRGSWSYRDVHARIARFGNALAGLGLRKGDRVALLVPDIREYLEADHAIMSMYREGVINVQRIAEVEEQWERPTFDWGDRTAWRLFNAATYALTGRVVDNTDATPKLHKIIDGVCERLAA